MRKPFNLKQQDATPAAIARDVAHALDLGERYLRALASVWGTPEPESRLFGSEVLEVGPGASLGTAVFLRCHGATVRVIDPFLPDWQGRYHGAFYRALLRRLSLEHRHLDPEPIESLLRRRRFTPDIVGCNATDLEEADLPAATLDIICSGAVLEHVADIDRAAASMSLWTRPGGVGIHQVDFRDHRDFARPLEYLTLGPDAFDQVFSDTARECGNRDRYTRFLAAFQAAGFGRTGFTANLFAEDEYLRSLAPRLHPAYAGLSPDELRVLSGLFVCEKRTAAAPPSEGTDLPPEAFQAFVVANRWRWDDLLRRRAPVQPLSRLGDAIAPAARLGGLWRRVADRLAGGPE